MNLTELTLAAAWRENLGDLRAGARPVAFTATEHPFNQLEVHQAPDMDPASLLEAILAQPVPPHVAAEFASARTGARIAQGRAERRAAHLAALAARTGAGSLAELVDRCTLGPDRTARLLETIATDGHLLHPGSRTRLGWEPADFERFDVETPRPVGLRLVADTGNVLSYSGADLRTHPILAGLDLPHQVLPVHPWQLEHRILPAHRELFEAGRLRLLPEAVAAWPTASVRTLAGHDAPGFLKVALGIQITSTRRDISPATAALAPVLHDALARWNRERGSAIGFVRDTGGAFLPGSRDLTAIARAPLHETTPKGAACVPATALAATSPVTGMSLAAEYAIWSANPDQWIRDYAALFVPALLDLAASGIGLEAHLQNSLVAMQGPRPVRALIRDLGGARIHTPTAPMRIDLPAESPVDAADMHTVRAKIGYTLFQNHLAALARALERDCGLDTGAFWSDLADLIAALPLPAADRDPYLAPRVPTKALLTMRLHPGADIEAHVDNPMHRRTP